MVGLPLNCERVIVLPNWSVSLKSGAIVPPRSVPWRADWLVLVVCAALLGVAVCLPVRFAQPQRNMRWLHGLLDHCYQLLM